MNLSKLVGNLAESGDPGAFLKQELEEGLEPITKRVDALEKKLDLIILTLSRIESALKAIQPVIEFVKRLPFLK
jgi:chaperonin cofactor prefoldin